MTEQGPDLVGKIGLPKKDVLGRDCGYLPETPSLLSAS